MGDTVLSIFVNLERIEILDPGAWPADAAVFFLPKIAGHSVGRTDTIIPSEERVIPLPDPKWCYEVALAGIRNVIVAVEAWNEKPSSIRLGRLSFQLEAPWDEQELTTVSEDGAFSLHWTVTRTVRTWRPQENAAVARRREDAEGHNTLILPRVAIVRITEILGLYKPGVDDRAVKPEGTIKFSSYVPGYTSQDDKGRIYTNRLPDGTWAKNKQYMTSLSRCFPRI